MTFRQYPIDRFLPAVVWPMEVARRVHSKWLKVCLVVWYPCWFVLCLPVFVPLLFISIIWMIWESVNEGA